jgi:oxygen-dependent protoporphyrinogen oxidase
MNRKPLVHIVGGGFSGLMAAFFCRRRGFEVRVSEAKSWGGLLQSEQTPWGLAEAAANGFLRTDLLDEVARDIEVPLLKPLPQARKRWIANERPERLPVSPLQALSGVLRFVAHRLGGAHRPRTSELLSEWGDRVLGSAVSERVLLPAMQGVYGVDSRRLSASLVLNPLFQKHREPRRGFAAPAQGMSQWTDRLLVRLRDLGVELREEALNERPNADHVILATSARAKAKLLERETLQTARRLSRLQTQPMVSVSTFWEKSSRDFSGFGVLFHPDHGWSASGVLLNHQIFENRSPHLSERYFFARPGDIEKSDNDLLEAIQTQRGRLGWSNRLLGFRVHRWPRALPLYSVELEKELSTPFELPAGVFLLGNELGEIGLTSLAERAHELALRIGEAHA